MAGEAEWDGPVEFVGGGAYVDADGVEVVVDLAKGLVGGAPDSVGVGVDVGVDVIIVVAFITLT